MPLTTVAEAGAVLIYVLHDVNALDLDPAAAGFHVVVSGHPISRKDRARRRLVREPGSAGLAGFTAVSLARLNLAEKPWNLEFVDLEAREK